MLLLFDLEEDDDCDIILSFPKKDFVVEVEDVCNFMMMMMMISFYSVLLSCVGMLENCESWMMTATKPTST